MAEIPLGPFEGDNLNLRHHVMPYNGMPTGDLIPRPYGRKLTTVEDAVFAYVDEHGDRFEHVPPVIEGTLPFFQTTLLHNPYNTSAGIPTYLRIFPSHDHTYHVTQLSGFRVQEILGVKNDQTALVRSYADGTLEASTWNYELKKRTGGNGEIDIPLAPLDEAVFQWPRLRNPRIVRRITVADKIAALIRDSNPALLLRDMVERRALEEGL